MNEQERRRFREFVLANHPDRGGDHDVFVAGLHRFATAAARPPVDGHPAADHQDHQDHDERYDRPVEVVRPLPFAVRAGVALIRTWRRRRRVQ